MDDACLWIWIEPNNNNNKKGLHVSFLMCSRMLTEHMDTNYVDVEESTATI